MGYQDQEIRLVQERGTNSAANADVLSLGSTVPAGKLWTVTAVAYVPSVAETQTVSFEKITRSGLYIGVFNPVSLALNPMVATPITEGMTLDLFPGETLQVRRGTHTAGSTMGLTIQFIETDLPLYDYVEPQAAARIKRAMTSLAERVTRAGGGGGSRGGGGRPASFRGGAPREK